MLNPDFKTRIGAAQVLEQLLKILQSMPDFNEARVWTKDTLFMFDDLETLRFTVVIVMKPHRLPDGWQMFLQLIL